MVDTLRFTVPEILSLIGLTQCVYILVYMAFRAGSLKKAIIPAFYFLFLGAAFFTDFAHSYISETSSYYALAQWFFWFMGPPLSVLLIAQICRIDRTPGLTHYWVLFLTPLAYAFGVSMALRDTECIFPDNCVVLMDWLMTGGLIAGAVSMLAIWGQREQLDQLYREKKGQERYWLVLTLIIANLFFLGLMLFGAGAGFTDDTLILTRTFSGLAFVYLASTSLFRIYPQALDLVSRSNAAHLTADEMATARRVEKLLNYDKIYHEASYSRADLARELEVPETTLSRIINVYFAKSFPQLLNERRVADARQLLEQTDAAMKVIAEEVGFNSLATFNRVFKDMEGIAPSAYRKERKI